ncbi:hypothetical protein STEG23_025142 [Scotinomys teguina]
MKRRCRITAFLRTRNAPPSHARLLCHGRAEIRASEEKGVPKMDGTTSLLSLPQPRSGLARVRMYPELSRTLRSPQTLAAPPWRLAFSGATGAGCAARVLGSGAEEAQQPGRERGVTRQKVANDRPAVKATERKSAGSQASCAPAWSPGPGSLKVPKVGHARGLNQTNIFIYPLTFI